MTDLVKVKDLVRDPNFHPRQGKIDPIHVSSLIDHIKAGAEMPPVIVDRPTMLLLSGWHRCAAVENMQGAEQALVEVEWREFETDERRFAEALRESAKSQLSLTSFNQQAILLRAQDLGMSGQQVAHLIEIPYDKLQRRVITAHITRRNLSESLTPLKAPFRHLAGGTINEDQQEVNLKSDGRATRYHAEQILRPLLNDMLPWTDQRMIHLLAQLRDALNEEPRIHHDEGEAAA